MSSPIENIREILNHRLNSLIDIRRHLHKHPELSFEEHKTADFIEQNLTAEGIPHRRVAKTGVLARIEGKEPGTKVIVLRGDTDALPIQESTGLPFESINKGVMHACGHDVHTTCVLGSALVLNELRTQFNGSIEILFQPAEEKLPGGASIVLKEGVFKESNPSAFVGQHVYPELEAGKVGFRTGKYMASADELYISVEGPGGHAALPSKTIDTIYAASSLIQSMQQVISRNYHSGIPAVLSFGKITGMGATNIIPKVVNIEGTFRTMDEEWRKKAHKRMTEIAEGIEKSTGAKIVLEIRNGYPCLVNDDETTRIVRGAAEGILGKDNVVDLEMRMTSEDFAYYSQHYPSCFYRLGTHTPGTGIDSLHSSEFIVDEAAIQTGILVMTNAGFHLLESN